MTTPTSHTASMDDLEGSFGDQYASKDADFSLEDALSSDRFPTEADADEDSFGSKNLSVDGLSRQELVDMVEKLYQNLKKADRALIKEQSRRGAREVSLAKLARQLRKHKETLASYLNHIDELQEEVQVARSERSLMEQRIDYLLAQNTSRTDGGLSHLATQLKEAQDRHDLTIREHERELQRVRIMAASRANVHTNTRRTALRSMSPLSLTLALPLSFMFLTDVGSRSMYLSYGLWSMTLLLLFQMAAADFEPYQINGGLVSAVAGRNFAIIGADTRMIGEGGYLLESRNHLSSRLWGVNENSVMAEIESQLRSGVALNDDSGGIMTKTFDSVPVMIGSSGCSTDCRQLKQVVQADIRASMHFGQIHEVNPGQVANLLSQTLYSRRHFPFYAFCVVSGLDQNNGGCGRVFVYDAIGSFEQVAVASAGTGREQLQPILDGLFQSTSNSKQVEGSASNAIEQLCKGYRAVSEREIGVGDNLVLHVSEIDDKSGEVSCRVVVVPLKKH
ncbi:MAG: hypothetical protein SGILL_008027 [Bacillariaceae sp.]